MSRRFPALLALAAALASAAPALAQPARETPPEPGPLRPYNLPPVKEMRLGNGLRVALVEQHALPIVTGALILDAGAIYEPAAKNGLAVLTGDLLSEGTADMTAAQIAERMDALGAQFGTSAGLNFAFAQVSALKPQFGEALGIVGRTVMAPAFRPADFERMRAASIAADAQAQSTVEGLAARTYVRAIYDDGSPYARPARGTRATLTGLTLDDVKAWHAGHYGPGNATLLLVGDLTEAEARQLAERTFGGWRAPASAPRRAENRARAVAGPRVILVDRPGSVQSAIWLGQAGIGMNDPDYIRFVALNHVLGGGATARVNRNLRERRGWTYGAFSGLSAQRGIGTFGISSSVVTGATDSAAVEALAEYRGMVEQEVPSDELRKALNNLVASFPSSVQTTQTLGGRIQTLVTYGLPLDYWATYRERLAAVTPAQVHELARRRLTPDRLTLVVVGDLSKIEAPIRARNLGTVEVWDAAGNKVR